MGSFLTAVLPSVGVLLIFWIAIRAMVQADRRERSAQARIEAEERRQNSLGTAGPAASE